MKRTLLYSLLLLALTACQDYITPEVPKDDLSSWMNEEGLVKGEVYVKFKQLDKDLQVVATRSGEVETGNKDLDAAAVNIWNACFLPESMRSAPERQDCICGIK